VARPKLRLVELAPARSLELSELRELFNHGFSDYLLPLQLGETAFREHLDANDIDLDCSQVVIDDTPASFSLIGRRGTEAWVGGMGTAPRHRRRGLGERALAAGVDAAGQRGCHAVWLEVLVENEAAIKLYEKLGFEVVRDVIVWSLPANGDGAASLPAKGDGAASLPTKGDRALEGRSVDLDQAHEWIVAHRPSREPWQRSDESLAKMRARAPKLRGMAVGRSGEVTGAVVFKEDAERVTALQIAAVDDASAADALLATTGGERDLRLSNAPVDEPASRALEHLGAQPVARQHEMLLRL
jgi:GNAT superfamily N-acetyltransferase